MQQKHIKISFINERVILDDRQRIITVLVNCVLKYGILDNLFGSCKFQDVSDFVNEILKENMFGRIDKYGMRLSIWKMNIMNRYSKVIGE